MNKKLITIGMSLIIRLVACGGCTEKQPISVDDNFELVSYSVESWNDRTNGSQEIRKIGDGFLHNTSVNEYRIIGIIRNKSEQNVDINLSMKFYDIQDIYLDSASVTLSNISHLLDLSFSYEVNNDVFSSNYIENFDKVEKLIIEMKEK